MNPVLIREARTLLQEATTELTRAETAERLRLKAYLDKALPFKEQHLASWRDAYVEKAYYYVDKFNKLKET